MSEIKIIKKPSEVEVRQILSDSPFKRFAVVRVCGKQQQSFRAWHKTPEAAIEVAKTYAADPKQLGGLYFVMEVTAGVGFPSEYDRKLPHIEWNDAANVQTRKATNGQVKFAPPAD